jgi:hypothetical protein
MHEKHHKDGLVCMSLCTDRDEERPKALEFLQKNKAAFPNYWMPQEAAQEKFDFTLQPFVVVFGKDGKVAHRFEQGEPYTQIEAVVTKLLRGEK